jgi:hypothetical protein
MTKWGFDLPSVTCVGDSLTTGTNSTASNNGNGGTGTDGQSIVVGTTNYPNRLKALLGGETVVQVRADAYPGKTIALSLNKIKSNRLHHILYNKSSSKSQKLVVFNGTNDLNGGMPAASALIEYRRQCLDAIELGYEVIAVTILPRQDAGVHANFEANRVLFNESLRTGYRDFAHKLVDFDTKAELMNPLNTTYFAADKVHLTDAGYTVVDVTIYPYVV